MTGRRTYVLVVDEAGLANVQELREWLRDGWIIRAIESRPYGAALAIAITVEREGDTSGSQRRWRAKRTGKARGLPH